MILLGAKAHWQAVLKDGCGKGTTHKPFYTLPIFLSMKYTWIFQLCRIFAFSSMKSTKRHQYGTVGRPISHCSEVKTAFSHGRMFQMFRIQLKSTSPDHPISWPKPSETENHPLHPIRTRLPDFTARLPATRRRPSPAAAVLANSPTKVCRKATSSRRSGERRAARGRATRGAGEARGGVGEEVVFAFFGKKTFNVLQR